VVVHRIHDHAVQPVSEAARRIVDEIAHGFDEFHQHDLGQLVGGFRPDSAGQATGANGALIALSECGPRPLIARITDCAEEAGPSLGCEGTRHLDLPPTILGNLSVD
jgi:hypothetical protein